MQAKKQQTDTDIRFIPPLLDPQKGTTRDELSEELCSVLLAIPAGILFVNPLGLVELVNDAANALFQENVKGMYWREVIKKHFVPQQDDGLEVSLKNGRKLKFSISSLPQQPGQLIHLTDLTDTRALQSKISRLEKLSSLGKMVASLAHQLRTPLSAAMLYARNIQGNNINQHTLERFSNKLVSRLKELEGQINDMLLFAKSGSSGVLESVEMLSFLGKVITELNESVHTRQVELTFKAALEPCHLNINPQAIKGALENLINNAVESGAGRVVTEFLQQNGGYQIIVSDDGPGIPEVLQRHIFEPFYTTRSQGTGLGLAVVVAVAKSHQGTVSVTTGEKGGARFVMCLPLCLQAKSSSVETLKPVETFKPGAGSPTQNQLLAGEMS